MKHNFLFTIFILLVGILFGCGRKQDEISQEFTMPSSILESKEMIGENGTLYYIPNENIEAGFMQNIISFQDNFLLYRISDEATGLNLKLISSQTGEVIAESTLLDIELPNIQTCGNQLAISDWEDGKIVLLNDRLQEITKYKVTSEYNSIYLSPDVKKAYVFTPDKGLQITNLSQGEMETKLEEAVNLFVSVECGMNVTFTYTDRKTQRDQYGVLNLQTGEITESPFKGSFYDIQYVNDVWMASNSDAMNIRYFVMDKDMKKFESSDDFGFMTIHPETVNLITTY